MPRRERFNKAVFHNAGEFSRSQRNQLRRMRQHRRAFISKMKRPLFVSTPPPESKKISTNSALIQFLCKEANQAQLEAVLFEIDPHQLSALRELISNATKRDKFAVERFFEETSTAQQKKGTARNTKGTAHKNIEKGKSFLDKLLSEKATRMMLRKNSRLLKNVLSKGYKHYENRSGITLSSQSGKERSKKIEKTPKINGQQPEQNPEDGFDEDQESTPDEEMEENSYENPEEDNEEQQSFAESENDGPEQDFEREYEESEDEDAKYETDNARSGF